MQEAQEKLRESWLDLWYEIGKALGVIWLVKRIKFLELRSWVKEREQQNG